MGTGMDARRYVFFSGLILLIAVSIWLTACGRDQKAKRGKDLDYTVVPTADCPKDFLNEIEKKKINAFQMTYDDGAYRYIAVGYGEQETNGFNIRVQGLYEKGNEICIETSLTGPDEDSIVSHKKSFPFLVIKTQKTEKKVNFFV